jgi:hypothetical protein
MFRRKSRLIAGSHSEIMPMWYAATLRKTPPNICYTASARVVSPLCYSNLACFGTKEKCWYRFGNGDVMLSAIDLKTLR